MVQMMAILIVVEWVVLKDSLMVEPMAVTMVVDLDAKMVA